MAVCERNCLIHIYILIKKRGFCRYPAHIYLYILHFRKWNPQEGLKDKGVMLAYLAGDVSQQDPSPVC